MGSDRNFFQEPLQKLLPAPHNEITRNLNHGIHYGAFTLPWSSAISPDDDHCLFGSSVCEEIADLPCRAIVDLRTIQKKCKSVQSSHYRQDGQTWLLERLVNSSKRNHREAFLNPLMNNLSSRMFMGAMQGLIDDQPLKD